MKHTEAAKLVLLRVQFGVFISGSVLYNSTTINSDQKRYRVESFAGQKEPLIIQWMPEEPFSPQRV